MIGIYNICKYYPPVLKGLSPHYMIIFFARNGMAGWAILGAVFLCVTGIGLLLMAAGRAK